MDTREMIKAKGLELFNAYGLLNVTLRDVAKELDKSYGNITYHYKTKEHLVKELYADMMIELRLISGEIVKSRYVLEAILAAPGLTFNLSMKYLFMFKDFIEIKRNLPSLSKEMEKNNEAGKKNLKKTLLQLQEMDLLRKDIDDEDLDYLMELSGAMRTFFLLNLQKEELHKKDLKEKYACYINRLLSPYLSTKGKKIYNSFGQDV